MKMGCFLQGENIVDKAKSSLLEVTGMDFINYFERGAEREVGGRENFQQVLLSARTMMQGSVS